MIFVGLVFNAPLTVIENIPLLQEMGIAAAASIMLVVNGTIFTLLYTDLDGESDMHDGSSDTDDGSHSESSYIIRTDTHKS